MNTNHNKYILASSTEKEKKNMSLSKEIEKIRKHAKENTLDLPTRPEWLACS